MYHLWDTPIKPFAIHILLCFFALMFMLDLKHKKYFGLRMAAAFLVAAVFYQIETVYLPSVGWQMIFYLGLNACLLFWFCCDLPILQIAYGSVWVLMTLQLAVEVWALHYLINLQGTAEDWQCILQGLAFFILLGLLLKWTLCRWLAKDGEYQVGPRQTSLALALLFIFEFAYAFLLYDGAAPLDPVRIALIQALQLCHIFILLFIYAIFRKNKIQEELDMLNRLWYEQRQQYDLAREHIAIINRKCHDLKHQLVAMRSMVTPDAHEKYIAEIEHSVRIYDSIFVTGNEVLDTLLTQKSLYCETYDIQLHCVVDGKCLGFMDPVDLYTVMGNALDNALEYVQDLPNTDYREVDVLVYSERGCAILQVSNPLQDALTFEEGLPATTKNNVDYHGYGLKSIRYTIQKYGGYMKIKTENSHFVLKMIIPLEDV